MLLGSSSSPEPDRRNFMSMHKFKHTREAGNKGEATRERGEGGRVRV